jgi:hypothetical protein
VNTGTFRTENPELTPRQPSVERPRVSMLTPVRVVVVESDAEELSNTYNNAALAAVPSQKFGEQWSLEQAEKASREADIDG